MLIVQAVAACAVASAVVADASPPTAGLPHGCLWCPATGCGTGLQPPYSKSAVSCDVDSIGEQYDPVGTATAVSQIGAITELHFSVNIPPDGVPKPSDATIAQALQALQKMRLTSLGLFIGDLTHPYGTVTPSGLVNATTFSGQLRSSLLTLSVDYSLNFPFSDGDLSVLGASFGGITNLEGLTINLEQVGKQASFGAPGATRLLSGLSKAAKLTSLSLDMTGSRIGDADMSSLGGSFARLQQLESLDVTLAELKLTDASITPFVSNFQTSTKLTAFSIGFKNNDMSGAGFQALVTSVLKIPNLATLGTNFAFQEQSVNANDIQAAASLVEASKVGKWMVNVVQLSTNTSTKSKAVASALACSGSKISGVANVGSFGIENGQASCTTEYSVVYSSDKKCLQFSGFASGPPGMCPATGAQCVGCSHPNDQTVFTM